MAQPRTPSGAKIDLASSRPFSWLVIAGVVVLGLWSIVTLRFQTELLPLFPPDLPSVQLLKKAQTSLMSQREVLAVARPGTNPGWAALQKLADGLRHEPGIGDAQVGLGSSGSPSQWMAGLIAALPAERFAALEQALTPDAVVARLHDTLEDMSGAVDETEMGHLRFDPLRLNEMIFPDSGALENSLQLPPVLTLSADHPLKTFEDDQKFVEQVRASLKAKAINLSPAPLFLLTGEPAITAEISVHMKRDIIVMLAFTLILISLAFWLTYRSLMPLLWIILAQILAVFCAAAAARLIFAQVNVLSIGFSSILLGVGMDYCILVYHYFAQAGDLEPKEWQELRRAIWLSALTTAATFGLLYFSSFPGLRQLAVLVGIGLIATAFFATTLLAELLARHRPRAPAWLAPASDRSARFMSRNRVAFRATVGLLIATAVVLLPKLLHFPFYDPGVEQLEPSNLEPYQAQQILQDQLGHLSHPDFSVGDPEANRRRWNPVEPGQLEKEFAQAGFEPTWAAPSLQTLDLLNRWHAGTLDLTGPAQASTAWVQLRSDLNRTALSDFKRLSLVMFAVVFTLCLVAHRSLRLVALNLAALLLSMLILALLLYASGTSMTILSLLCLPLMIGLVIDYSLHILLALEHAHGDLVEAFRHLAVPVLLTGLASIIGFTAPMLSSQPALQNFGNVMDLGTLAAVASGLILLPALYGRLKPSEGSDKMEAPHSERLYRASLFSWGAMIAKIFPRDFLHVLAGFSGALYAWTHPARVRVVQRNLQLLDGSLDSPNARGVYREFAKTLVDYFYIGTRSPEEARQIVVREEGLDYFEQARQSGQGALVVTAHFGLFELGGLLLACHGFPTAVLTYPEPNRALGDWRVRFRRRWNVETIEIGPDPFAFLQIADRLRRGYFVASLIDRPHPLEKIQVQLPNGTAFFSPGILLLAAHTGVPVIPATMVRDGKGSYHSRIFPPLWIKSRESRTETLQFYSQQIADILAPVLCASPEQWYQFVPLSSSPLSSPLSLP